MMDYLFLVFGIILLIKGAEWLIDGASALAKRMGISSLIVGLTVVAFGTSVPELIVNIFAALNHNSEISFGNIIGSNIANILLILAIGAIILSQKIPFNTVWKEIPISLLAVIVLVILASDIFFGGSADMLSRKDGIVLLVFFIGFMLYIFDSVKSDPHYDPQSPMHLMDKSAWHIIFFIIAGGVALYFGGKLTVDTAIAIARSFNISEFIISATIIGIGTSMPELITTIVATYRQEKDIAVGNIVGSNIINIFLILGITSLINPLTVNVDLTPHFIFLIGATVMLFAFMFIGEKHVLKRWQGIIMIIFYFAYLFYVLF